MDDTNLAPWIRVINEGNSVEIPLKERGGR